MSHVNNVISVENVGSSIEIETGNVAHGFKRKDKIFRIPLIT